MDTDHLYLILETHLSILHCLPLSINTHVQTAKHTTLTTQHTLKHTHVEVCMGFPGSASDKETAYQCRRLKRGMFHICVTVHYVVLSLVTQSCLTLWDPMDCSLPGSSVHRDSPGKNTGVGCHALLQESSQPRDQTEVSHIAGGFFIIWATKGSTRILECVAYPFSKGTSRLRKQTRVSCIALGFFISWATKEAWATVHRVSKSRTRLRQLVHTAHTCVYIHVCLVCSLKSLLN